MSLLEGVALNHWFHSFAGESCETRYRRLPRIPSVTVEEKLPVTYEYPSHMGSAILG